MYTVTVASKGDARSSPFNRVSAQSCSSMTTPPRQATICGMSNRVSSSSCQQRNAAKINTNCFQLSRRLPYLILSEHFAIGDAVKEGVGDLSSGSSHANSQCLQAITRNLTGTRMVDWPGAYHSCSPYLFYSPNPAHVGTTRYSQVLFFRSLN